MSTISPTGLWVDDASGKVVDSPPVSGVQLVAPGLEITPDVQASLSALGWSVAVEVSVSPPVEDDVADAPEVAVVPEVEQSAKKGAAKS